ncbi:mRNA export factor mex67 [Grifola frondosa]|uniref:mRNA export factor mex67 n=1 Tax=Grifola frondosa TaxID=5627 RepID=A0A1C7M5V1_GRIFR|nr:mRNA export factor mex67 [Grifola frondosa]
MFSSPTPAPGSRSIAANALRSAGLMDRDARMRDVSDKPGGRKGSSKQPKTRSHPHRPRTSEQILGKDSHSSSRTDFVTRARRVGFPLFLLYVKSTRLTCSFISGVVPSSCSPQLAARIAVGDSSVPRGVMKGTVLRSRRNAISLSSMPRTEVVELWRQFVNIRWNAEAKFLNLERLADDEFLRKHRLLNPMASTSGKEAAVVFKLASQLVPEVQTISLAHNNMTTGANLTSVARYLPKLVNLSLENNKLQQWRDIDYISGRRGKLENLRELILIGNPVRDLEYQNNRSDRYKSEITRRFPALEILDQEPVTRVGFDAPTASTSTSTSVPTTATSTVFPSIMGPSFIAGVDGALVSNFFMRYFPLFDNQRGALLDVYDPAATFSFSVNTAIPTQAARVGSMAKRWLRWLPEFGQDARRLGQDNEGVAYRQRAGSQGYGGPTSYETRCRRPPEKFCVDAFPVAQGDRTTLLVTVHGQFAELPVEGIRSFDRSFVLAIAPEGSRAKLNGWDVVILSDQLVVRAYSSHEAWRPGPMRVQAGDSLPSPQLLDALTNWPEPQRTLILQICLRTRLNVKYAVECLQNNGWDPDRAVANFESVKGQLQGDVYLSQDAFLS